MGNRFSHSAFPLYGVRSHGISVTPMVHGILSGHSLSASRALVPWVTCSAIWLPTEALSGGLVAQQMTRPQTEGWEQAATTLTCETRVAKENRPKFLDRIENCIR